MNGEKKIGNRIAEARKRNNISQSELAQRLFISPQAVGKWERGESMPDIVTFERLAECLGVDLNYFSEIFGTAEVSKTAESIEKPELPKNKAGWNMSHGNWAHADFSGLKNLNERFSSSNMHHCQFIGSELSGLLLKNNNVASCDFSGSDLSKCTIQSSNLENNLYKKCILTESEIKFSNISACDFSETDFTNVGFKNSNFEKNIISDAIWKNTSFSNSNLNETVFEGRLENCSFENCGFNRVKFQNATIVNTFFKNNKKLKKVEFINCKADKISYAFLKNNQVDVNGIILIDN